ncbi:MAG: hypothetical protein PGN13_05210 [Patulibacter minatonensis]
MKLRSLAWLVLLLAWSCAPAQAEIAGGATPATIADQSHISSGGLGTCAVTASAEVQCWGEGYDGQLLSGSEQDLGDDPGEGPAPIFLGRGVKVASVSYASSHACAVDIAGAVFCWGRNIYGQLGNDARGNSTGDAPGERAVRVPIAPATQVATGDEHSCALLVGGSITCWGGNVGGQLGRGSADDSGDAPGPVDLGGATATSIAARGAHTCVLLTTHEMRCWGSNGFGESGTVPASLSESIGDQPGEKPVKPTVLPVSTQLDLPVAMALGRQFTCVITGAGDVRCWGRGSGGALLTGNQNTIGDTPGEMAVTMAIGGKAKAIAAGSSSACALRTDGELRCWGDNTEGMLGTGMLGNNWGDQLGETTALAVPLGSGRSAAAISIGIRHMCALLTTGEPLCWGESEDGEWGTGEEGGNNVKAQDRKPVAFSGALADGDGDGLPDRFDACPTQSAPTDDGCPLPVITAPPTPAPPVTQPPASTWPVQLSAKKVTFDVLLVPKGKTCPSKAELKIRVELKTKLTKTITLKKSGKGKTLRCRAKGSVTLKKAPDGGALVTAKFTAKGVKGQTVVAERVA